jgi:CspA family cold shock protein
MFRSRRAQARRFLLAGSSDRRSTAAIVIARESNVAGSGTVKFFNTTKGYGFIQPDTGGKDVFVHISAVEKAGLDGLREGDKVTYDMIIDRGKESAGNLRLK